jgi:hypothetical protein
MKDVWRHIGIHGAVLMGAFGLVLAALAGPAVRASVSVRHLNPAEAAALTGGICHDCEDCEIFKDTCQANGVGNCSKAGDSCTTNDVTEASGAGTIRKKCVSSGALSGGCGPEAPYSCLVDGDVCQCTIVAPDWVCTPGGVINRSITMSQDPCN